MGRMNLRMGASGVGSKVWVLTIGVLEDNPERDSIRAQRGRARSAHFSRVSISIEFYTFWYHAQYQLL